MDMPGSKFPTQDLGPVNSARSLVFGWHPDCSTIMRRCETKTANDDGRGNKCLWNLKSAGKMTSAPLNKV